MAFCKSCGKKIKINQIIDGKLRNLSSRSYCLDCHPFGVHPSNLISEDEKVNRKIRYKFRDKIKNIEKTKQDGYELISVDVEYNSVWKCKCCDYVSSMLGIKKSLLFKAY